MTGVRICFTLQCFSVILLALMLSWESEGVRIFDLNDSVNHVNYRNPIYCYLAVAILTVVFAIVMTVLGGGGFDIPPLLVSTDDSATG